MCDCRVLARGRRRSSGRDSGWSCSTNIRTPASRSGCMLSTLFAGTHAVTAVGDPNQAIYGWRGASASNLLRFGEHYAPDQPARRAATPDDELPLRRADPRRRQRGRDAAAGLARGQGRAQHRASGAAPGARCGARPARWRSPGWSRRPTRRSGWQPASPPRSSGGVTPSEIAVLVQAPGRLCQAAPRDGRP